MRIFKLLVLLFCAMPNVYAAQLSDPDFFPISVWLQSPSRAEAYKNAGVNLYIGLWNDLNREQLSALKDAGMYVMCRQNAFGLKNLGDTTILGWTHRDEPDNAQWNEETQSYDPCIAPEEIIAYYNELKANDSSRPVYLNLGRGVSHIDWYGRGACTGKYEMYIEENDGYIAGCDIASFDIYPVNSTDTATSEKLWYVPKGIDSLISWSSKPRPTWCWIETTKIRESSNRQPTPAEVKSEVWMAIIHGATGIGYFCHSWTPTFDEAALLHDSVMIENVASINRTIASLAPVLNSPNDTTFASATGDNTEVPIDIMTKYYDGAYYIFAVAMREGNTTGYFNIASGSTIEVIGEDRTFIATDGTFYDDFTDYEVHIYKIPSPNSVRESNNRLSAVSIYPNPSDGRLNIRTPKGIGDYTITVYNALSETVYQSKNARTIDLTEQSSGVYYLELYNGGRAITRKILILK